MKPKQRQRAFHDTHTRTRIRVYGYRVLCPTPRPLESNLYVNSDLFGTADTPANAHSAAAANVHAYAHRSSAADGVINFFPSNVARQHAVFWSTQCYTRWPAATRFWKSIIVETIEKTDRANETHRPIRSIRTAYVRYSSFDGYYSFCRSTPTSGKPVPHQSTINPLIFRWIRDSNSVN